MQGIINILVVLNTIILGYGVYLVVTAKPERVSREAKPTKTENTFKSQDGPKKRGRPLGSKNKAKAYEY
jgi:hypothetical protein